jgi:hypothetical protein
MTHLGELERQRGRRRQAHAVELLMGDLQETASVSETPGSKRNG